MDWEARMSMRTWTKQTLAEAEAITRDPGGREIERPHWSIAIAEVEFGVRRSRTAGYGFRIGGSCND